jgi:hypothetical protein
VTITAIDAIVADVMLMAELNGLGFDDIGLIPIRRARQPEKNVINGERGNSTRSHERYARYRVRALLKNLRHLLGFDVRISSETGRCMIDHACMMGSYVGERAVTNEDDRFAKEPIPCLRRAVSFVVVRSFQYKNNKKTERVRKNRIFVLSTKC